MIKTVRNIADRLFGWPENGWTSGQYSIFRILFGTYLLVHFVHLIPWGSELWSNQGALADGSASPLMGLFPNIFRLCDTPLFVTSVLVAAALFSLMLTAGWKDRLAAASLWYIWACLFGRNPFINNPGLPYVGMLLVVHALLPRGAGLLKKPTGEALQWRLPHSLYVVVWLLMAAGYTYSGWAKLASPSWVSGDAMERVLLNPLARTNILRDWALMLPQSVLNVWTWYALVLELAFLPLALIRPARPWLWLAGLSMHLGIITLVDFADLSLGMVMLHLFTFDPQWVRRKPAPRSAHDRVFYDGSCGLCHGAVKFLLAEDRTAEFRYAPLESPAFRDAVGGETVSQLPDSIVVLTADQKLLTKSQAVLYLLARLGGIWRLLGVAARLVPPVVRDAVYDLIAGSRKRLFAQTSQACPMLPRELRSRFDF